MHILKLAVRYSFQSSVDVMSNFSWGLSGELHATSMSSSTRSCDLVTRADTHVGAYQQRKTSEGLRIPQPLPRRRCVVVDISDIAIISPRYGETYNIGDNQCSSKNLSYCQINRFLESVTLLRKISVPCAVDLTSKGNLGIRSRMPF